jgi:MFS family permease
MSSTDDQPDGDRTYPDRDRAYADRDRGYTEDQTTTVTRTDRTDAAEAAAPTTRREVVAREKEAYGGMKFGSAFFGWLAASGTAVLLTALVASAGAVLQLSGTVGTVDTTNTSANQVRTVGLVGGIVLLAVIFVAYFAGGYVAGRMARFNGVRQGIGVWLWAIIVAVVIAVLGVLAGARFDVLARLNSFPRLPVNEGTLTTAGILVAAGMLLVSLVGAILGGMTGMRYHRKVDRAGFGA